MGADLCLAIADAPPPGLTDRGHILDILSEAVATLDDDVRTMIEDQFFEGERAEGQALWNRVVDAYDEVAEAMRDVAYVILHDRPYWISGGMTWGDTPTDNYDNVLLLSWINPKWEA